MSKVLGIILALGVVLGGGGYFLVKEAYAATPADPLFPVQEIADDVQRALTFDEVAKVELEQEILARRQDQVDRMVNREDVTGEQLEEALQLMAQQREKVQVKLQEVEQKMEQNEVNENAKDAIQNVQQKYDENLDKQLETIGESQAKYGSVDPEIVDEIVQEATERGRSIPSGLGGSDGSNGSNGSGGNSGSNGGSENGNN